MGTRTYEVTLTGKTPMLMHSDNIEWADQMDVWKSSLDKSTVSKNGDDRSPAWRWLGCLYHDDNQIVLPSDNLARCFMEGGASVPTGGKNGKTFKAQSQSGMMTGEPVWPLIVNGKPIPIKTLMDLRKEDSFAEHKKAASKLGFQLFIKRAKIGSSKHVRVRPRFDNWGCKGTVVVWDDQITIDVLRNIIDYAGKYKGLGDWRPGGRTPGPHGMFAAKVEAV